MRNFLNTGIAGFDHMYDTERFSRFGHTTEDGKKVTIYVPKEWTRGRPFDSDVKTEMIVTAEDTVPQLPSLDDPCPRPFKYHGTETGRFSVSQRLWEQTRRERLELIDQLKRLNKNLEAASFAEITRSVKRVKPARKSTKKRVVSRKRTRR